LTDPLDDPESYYLTKEDWQALGPLGRAAVRFQTLFVGRMLIGPAWAIGRFIKGELMLLLKGDTKHLGIWLRHGIGVALVLIWIKFICDLPVWFYCLCIVYPGTSLLLIRSFAEHRAAERVAERTAIVENAPVLGVLFLFNNLHAAHHAEPTLPWYEIPAWYRAHRERLIAENDGHLYDGYFDVIRRYLFRPHHWPEHPTNRAPRADGSKP
jgi:fatty acid desaturase